MRIETSAVAMAGLHNSTEAYSQNESLQVWVGNQEAANPDVKRTGNSNDILQLSRNALNRWENMAKQQAKCPEEAICLDIPVQEKQKLILIEKLLEALTGKKIKITIPAINQGKSPDAAPAPDETASPAAQEAGNAGWGLVYENHERYEESEKTFFTAAGIIKTADGKEIDFEVQMSMSRQFIMENHISVRAGDGVVVDPLVINYAGRAAELTATKFSFDLDSNGADDQISFVSPGSGFLAIDTNKDGIVTNGAELFGPQTGNGFLELSRFDEDNNRWIDENDSIFSDLRVWTKDEKGIDTLSALGQVGIGAIYLGNIETDFSFKNQANELLGQARRTGIFMGENGIAGTVQQIDMVI